MSVSETTCETGVNLVNLCANCVCHWRERQEATCVPDDNRPLPLWVILERRFNSQKEFRGLCGANLREAARSRERGGPPEGSQVHGRP